MIMRTVRFAIALLRASLTDWQSSLISLCVPLLLLLIFRMVERPPAPGEIRQLNLVFPTVVGLTAMLGGQAVMTRLITWRQQGVFQRLACAPTPLGMLVVGAGLAQTAISMAQAVLVIAFGGLMMGLPVDASGALAATGILLLCAVCFVAYGMVIASLSSKAETGGAVYMFTLLPMYFLGSGLFNSTLPPFLKAVAMWLPTAMGNTLVSPLMMNGAAPAGSVKPVSGLLIYTIAFAALAAWRFRWE